MAHKIMIYKRDYKEHKQSYIWDWESTKCNGFKLTIDNFGYKGVSCENIISKGDPFYLKDCECLEHFAYCSEHCCWG